MADLNIRNVPDAVLERLRDQADLEGVSVSDWVRAALAHRAELRTPAELRATRQRLAEYGQSLDEFERYYSSRLHRRGA